MMASYRQSKASSIAAEGSSNILPSSTELFYFYRETLERCAKLSNKSPFLDLCGVYKKWLKVYAEEVLSSSLTLYVCCFSAELGLKLRVQWHAKGFETI